MARGNRRRPRRHGRDEVSGGLGLFPDLTPSHDPGGIATPLPTGVSASAIYGGDNDCYRYLLDWRWDCQQPTFMACMMNPSCAGHLCGDRTLAWLYRWCSANCFGRLLVVNASAYRAKDQARLAEVADPCGPENMTHIRAAAHRAHAIGIGYGQPKVRAVRDHGPAMVRSLRSAGHTLHVWALAKNGTPKHPLYLRGDIALTQWAPP